MKARTRFDIVAVFEDGAYVRFTSRPDRPLRVDELVTRLRQYAGQLESAQRTPAAVDPHVADPGTPTTREKDPF